MSLRIAAALGLVLPTACVSQPADLELPGASPPPPAYYVFPLEGGALRIEENGLPPYIIAGDRLEAIHLFEHAGSLVRLITSRTADGCQHTYVIIQGERLSPVREIGGCTSAFMFTGPEKGSLRDISTGQEYALADNDLVLIVDGDGDGDAAPAPLPAPKPAPEPTGQDAPDPRAARQIEPDPAGDPVLRGQGAGSSARPAASPAPGFILPPPQAIPAE